MSLSRQHLIFIVGQLDFDTKAAHMTIPSALHGRPSSETADWLLRC
jgi:hypothetical protein